MTEENKKKSIESELEKASDTLLQAELLFTNGFITGAVSRLYYFLLYYVRALLLTKDLQPKSHEGMLRVFGLHFVKEGFFEAQDSHIFARLMKYREEADYNPSYTFTQEDFVVFRKEAETLAGKIRVFLERKGYLA